MKGMVQPSSKSSKVLATCVSLIPTDLEMMVLNVEFIIYTQFL